MKSYIARRLLALLPLLLGVSLLVFAIIQLTPGDPARSMLGDYATEERVAAVRHQLGLDDPVAVQYGRYLWGLFHGDLGRSFRGQSPVLEEIIARLPSTLQLTVAAMTIAVVGGMAAGVLAGVARSRWADGLAMSSALLGLSVPNYWLAILCIILFGVNLRWISVTGGEGFKDLILPSLCLALGPGAVIARLTRSSMLEVKREDYVLTARAKGLSELRITLAHVLRTALIPVVTVVGLQFAGMLSGAVFIEAVFARPGIGRLAVNAIATRDYPQVQGIVLFLAIAYALANLAVDILYAALDPRIRYR